MERGDRIEKANGYRFCGVVLCTFRKRDGMSVRVAAENDDGIVHIFRPSQLKVVQQTEEDGE